MAELTTVQKAIRENPFLTTEAKIRWYNDSLTMTEPQIEAMIELLSARSVQEIEDKEKELNKTFEANIAKYKEKTKRQRKDMFAIWERKDCASDKTKLDNLMEQLYGGNRN